MLIGLAIFMFLVFLSLNLAHSLSAEEKSEKIGEAFKCLDDGINATASLTLEQAIFSKLADSNNSKVGSKIALEKSGSAECWPSSGCKIKESAQVAIAKIENGENADGIINWLKGQKGAMQGLKWYLQISIENNLPATCSVEYGTNQHTISIDENLKLSSSAGNCLSLANSNYWFEISDSCVDQEFEVSCDKRFFSNLLYTQSSGGTVFVSAETNPGDANGITREKIRAQCFREGGNCNYEGSLWATFALYKKGENTGEFAPYLRALSGENSEFFPEAFLYHIIEDTSMSDELHQDIVTRRRTGGLWEIAGSPHSDFYNTALGILSLGSGSGGINSQALEAPVEDLFDEQSPTSGCWGTLSDTAFVLYSTRWQRAGASTQQPPQQPQQQPNSCVGGVWYNGSGSAINTETTAGYCHLQSGGCCRTGFECDGEGSASICEEIPGFVDNIAPNVCFDGDWYDNNSQIRNTRSAEGYCHLVDIDDGWANGCCPDGYECQYEEGNESESICVVSSGGGGGSASPIQTDCELAGENCVADGFSCIVAGGQTLRDFTCHGVEACCSVDVPEQTCVQRGGVICEQGEICTGSVLTAEDTLACCSDVCESSSSSGGGGNDDTELECTEDSDCFDDEECVDNECVSVSSSGISIWIWALALLILIVVVIIAIVKKDQIRVWWHKRQGKVNTSRVVPENGPMLSRRSPPSFGASSGVRRMPPASVQTRRAVAPKGGDKEKEMEETLRKLKEMSE